MIKVMVVVWGLVMFVPEGVTVEDSDQFADQLTVVFANPGGQDLEHQPKVWLTDTNGHLQQPIVLPGEFQMQLSGSGTQRIRVTARKYFPDLSSLKAGATAKDVCVENSQHCKDEDDHDLVLGTASLGGDWTSRPASTCEGKLSLPVDHSDQASFSYRTVGNDQKQSSEPRLATALVLETEVSSVEDFVRILNSDSISLTHLSDATLCRDWIKDYGGSAGCAVLILGNPPAHPMKCSQAVCRRHDHFDVFYDLSQGFQHRWLPYVDTNEKCRFDRSVELPMSESHAETGESGMEPVTPPAVRCPPAFADGPDT